MIIFADTKDLIAAYPNAKLAVAFIAIPPSVADRQLPDYLRTQNINFDLDRIKFVAWDLLNHVHLYE